MNSRRRAPLAALALISVSALAGCAGGASGAVDEALPADVELSYPDEPVTITWIDEDNQNVKIGETIEAFEEKFPNITIDYQTVPHADYETALQSRLDTGDIDIVSVDQSVAPTFYAKGWIQDLTSVFGEDSLALLDSASVAGSTFDGKLIVAPRQSDSTILFYNKDLLDAAGVAYPPADPAADPITWQQVKADGIAAQRAGAEWGVTWERIASRYYQWPLAESNGAGTGLDPDDSLAPELDSPEAIEALQWYGDLFTEGVSPKGDSTSIYTDLFAQGKSAFHTGGAWDIETLNANPALNYGIARFPTFEGGIDASNSGGVALGLYPGSKHKAEALFVIQQLVFAEDGGELNYNADASSPSANDKGKELFWALPRFQDERAATLQSFVDYQLQNGVAKPVVLSLGSSELQSIVSQALADIAGGTPAETALAAAQKNAVKQFAKYRE